MTPFDRRIDSGNVRRFEAYRRAADAHRFSERPLRVAHRTPRRLWCAGCSGGLSTREGDLEVDLAHRQLTGHAREYERCVLSDIRQDPRTIVATHVMFDEALGLRDDR